MATSVGEPVAGQCIRASEPSVEFYGQRGFPSSECKTKAAALVSRMSVPEKVGQMLQAGHDQLRGRPGDVSSRFVGSVLSGGGQGPNDPTARAWAKLVSGYREASLHTRLAIPILYGIDAVHGHNNVRGAVIFPHNIGLGATRDAELVERVARVTAQEVAATGIDWTFAPVVAAARDERWGRTYEAFGESYELAAELGAAAIRGYQGKRLGNEPGSVLACAKHFLGDGQTEGGKDQGDARIAEPELSKRLIPAYRRAVDAGVGSVMASFSSINGVKMHCNGHLLTDVLKRQLGFDGFIVSDWMAVKQVRGNDYAEQLANSINAGLDMVMHPTHYAEYMDVMGALAGSEIPMARIDDAVRRIVAVKCEMGLLSQDQRSREAARRALLEQVGSESHRAVAREAVHESLVVLKNEASVLPIHRDVQRVHLAGRFADDLGAQCGGWTITWQGSHGALTEGTTVRGAFEQALSKDRVTFMADGTGAEGADVAVAVIGEGPYAEGAGDREELGLDAVDVEVVKKLKAAGVPVVVLLLSGRPLVLGDVYELADAVVAAWLPGSEGRGITDVLLGEVAPAGKLSHSWPREMRQVPINFGDPGYDPLFEYGYGLTYSPTSGT